MASEKDLQLRLGYEFRNPQWLRLALTHPSVAQDSPQGTALEHNQRLEFLGDSVLGLILSQQLYSQFPQASEGQLSKMRAALANTGTLAKHSRELGLLDHLLVGRGEQQLNDRDRAGTLADTFEAVLGAIYLDGGLEPAREFVLREFMGDLKRVEPDSISMNPKGELQELLQDGKSAAPSYQLISSEGPQHSPKFMCAVLHQGKELARGTGQSKKAAEINAAYLALRKLKPGK